MTETTNAAPALLARLERIPTAWWHVRARMILGVATFFDAFDLLAISFALPALVGIWKMTPPQIGLVLSAAFVGQLLGAIVAGWAAERYGRLFVATITIALFSVMSLACAFAWDPNSLIAFRFVQGIGLGGEVPIATTYISELARAEGRGRFYILYELVFSFGLVAAGVIGYLIVPTIGWQSMFIVGAAPALIVFFLRRLLPESPRWLVSQGRLNRGRGRHRRHRAIRRRVRPCAAAAASRRGDSSAGTRGDALGRVPDRALSQALANRLGVVVLLLLDDLRADELAADALQDDLQPVAVAVVALRHDHQSDGDLRLGDLRLLDRPDRAAAMVRLRLPVRRDHPPRPLVRRAEHGGDVVGLRLARRILHVVGIDRPQPLHA